MDQPSEALDQPSGNGSNGQPPELRIAPEQGFAHLDSSPGRTIPPGVELAPGVELDSDDPALAETGRRVCVALTKAGARCSAPALRSELLCSAHAGRLDASAGGKARAESARLVAEDARNRAITARLGTRATLAAALAERHDDLRLVVHGLVDRAKAGDRQAALALLPFMTQALGTPASAQPTSVPMGEGEVLDLSTLDTASLQALLTPE